MQPENERRVRVSELTKGPSKVRRVPLEQPPASPPPAIKPFADLVDAVADRGVPIPSGIGALDRSLHGGGFRAGEVIGFAGAPGACKTMLAMQMARVLAASDCNVVALRADERASGLVQRIGQSLGYTRRELRAQGAEGERARAQCAEAIRLTYPTLFLADARDGHTVDSATAGLLELCAADGRQGVLVVDSIQRAARVYPGTDTRERVDRAAAACALASDSGVIVVFTSEVPRAFYRDRKTSQDLDPLSAFKESGDLEYLLDTALVLSRVKGEPGVVHVELPKVRDESDHGREPEFRMRLDRIRAELSEIPLPSDDERAVRAEAATEREAERFRERAKQAVLKHTCTSVTAIVERMGEGRNQTKRDIVNEMVAEGLLVQSSKRDPFRLAR